MSMVVFSEAPPSYVSASFSASIIGAIYMKLSRAPAFRSVRFIVWPRLALKTPWMARWSSSKGNSGDEVRPV